jgi:antitoxin ParD1/3/4
MAHSLKISLTDELKAFIDQNPGEETLFSTPSEFVSNVLREKQNRLEATRIRNSILVGYADAIEGRTHEYRGNLRELMNQAIE